MDVQFKVNLPFNGWDYIPLPSVYSYDETESYELIIKLQLSWFPPFVSKLLNNYFGLNVPTVTTQARQQPTSDTVQSTTEQLQPESPFVTECRSWIEAGHFVLCEEGVGGTYFIKNPSGSYVAVFKPNDEEPGAPSNPKDLIQTPLLPPGGGYLREVAAYLLDSDHFSGVPETYILSKVTHANFANNGEKTGSLQRFIKNEGVSSDMGNSSFSIDAVHRIGVLDLRIFNMDRNGENLLVQRQDAVALVPIDHTYSLPPITSLDSAYFEWHYWPQTKKPFSQETLNYIYSINIENDAHMLRSLGLPESSILTMVVSSLLLKEAATAGWTLFDIANFVSRKPPATQASKLEEIVSLCLSEASEDANAFLVSFQLKLRSLFPTQDVPLVGQPTSS